MKARKILFLISGIFNCVVGGFCVLFGGLMVLLKGTLRTVLEESKEFLDEYVKTLVEADKKYEYLTTASSAEVLDFITQIISIVGIVLLVMGLIWIGAGIVNLLLTNNYKFEQFKSNKLLKFVFVAASWVLLLFNVANITTTIAIFLKTKDEKAELYSVNEG